MATLRHPVHPRLLARLCSFKLSPRSLHLPHAALTPASAPRKMALTKHTKKALFVLWFNSTVMHPRTHGNEKPNGKSGGQGDDNDVLAIRMQAWTIGL